MPNYLGSGVSRTLDASDRQFVGVVFQDHKPPCDAELNLQDALVVERGLDAARSQVPSGFFVDPTVTLRDFVTNPSWSNHFILGRQETGEDTTIVWANVAGMLVPVVGTGLGDGLTGNKVRLYPPPDSDARTDLVFIEVWKTLVAPNPSEENKPSASTIWRYGNVEFGGTNFADDLLDPAIDEDTTKRVQIQYRIRVHGQGAGAGSSVALDVYPDGLGDPTILGQGGHATPVAGFPFVNMREDLGDPSLWRAGDGDYENDLGTVDGYVYAIPICAVFRRNSSPFSAVENSGAANQNGGLDRNPSAASLVDPRTGAKVLTSPVLTNIISESSTGALAVTGLASSGFDDADLDLGSTFLIIDDEIIGPVTSVSSSTIVVAAGTRGRYGTAASPHQGGATVRFFNPRPDNLFADQVADTDILDLRKIVSYGDWDYQRILVHNLTKIVQGTIRTSYKKSATGDTQGTSVLEVSYMLADGSTAVPLSTEAVDGTDGLRTVFSDAAAIQPDVTVLCDAPTVAGTVASLDAGVEWDVGADFRPSGFITDAGYANGSVIFLNIGGADGTTGARGTFRDGSTRGVRFLSPEEYWKTNIPDATTGNQNPVQIRFLGEPSTSPAANGESSEDHPGPMYPTKATNFEHPFIVLGGVLNDALVSVGVSLFNNSPSSGDFEVQLPGEDFDIAGSWYPTGDVESLSTDEVTNPVLRGQRTLFDMLTAGGTDQTGRSSEVYMILYGDSTNPENCGAFQVIGAGTVGYTNESASASDRVRVRALSDGWSSFTLPPAGSVTAEIRSQHTNSEDGSGGSSSGSASLVIVWTDIEGTVSGSRWSSCMTAPVSRKMVITTTLQYHPGRGAMRRVPRDIWRVAGVALGSDFLREAPGGVDSTFPSLAGTPANETYFDLNHVQTWNRLSSRGLSAPDAPAYGGEIAAFSEQTREAEVLFDAGSKTIVLRPLMDRSMTLQSVTSRADSADTLIGSSTYPGPEPTGGTVKDGAGLWTTGLHTAFDVPPEYMPRFGRQDIPYRRADTTGTFLPGVNHLFTDSTDVNEAQSYIIGGQDSTTTAIRPLYIQTGSTSGLDYGVYGTITGPGTSAYQGQIVDLPNVISSDLGRGMKAIQLPPYIGVARLYGVYDRRDYVAQGGSTFNSDRTTPAASPATNLLRTDATKQTLFILQGGAESYTGSADDHVYLIPSDGINIELSPTYVDGETFEDIEYVVELCAFGFARGFINKNNYVLCRRHKGSSTLITDATFASGTLTVNATLAAGDTITIDGVVMTGNAGPRTSGSNDFDATLGTVTLLAAEIAAAINDRNNDFARIVRASSNLGVVTVRALRAGTVGNALTQAATTTPGGRITASGATLSGGTGTEVEAEGVRMTIPSAAPASSFYVGYSRIPYQGDPYMSRAGSSRVTTDYTSRYGQIPIASQHKLTSSIQQYDTDGDSIPETPNRRQLQVLAALDFYTTMGTGKIGGSLYGGTLTDVSYTENTSQASSRLPTTSSDPQWRVLSRAFTAGQKDQDSFASLTLNVENNGVLSGTALTFKIPDVDDVVLTANTDYVVGGSASASASAIVSAIRNHPSLGAYLIAFSFGTSSFTITSTVSGSSGNRISVTVSNPDAISIIRQTRSNSGLTRSNLIGGVDAPVNAGDGTSRIDLTGMTERLPLGILLQDSDFLCENPLGDTSSAFATQPPGIQAVQSQLPLAEGGQEYTRFLGGPGQWVALSDGGVLEYEAFDTTTAPTGTKKFRLFRGGGAAFVVSDPVPGGPIEWVAGSFPESTSPVLKGGILVCKALLVRNFEESAFSSNTNTSHGDEIQLLILTYGHLGDGSGAVALSGVISPTGYGEGYAAADRYRLEGRPMLKGRIRVSPEDTIVPAVYPGTGADPV